MVTTDALVRQEAVFARAFAAQDLSIGRELYQPDVVYLSPTVRLFGWPARIEGVERTLEFVELTIRGCRSIDYRAVETAIDAGGHAAFVRVHFDWDDDRDRRLRSNYVVVYRYRGERIAQQELYYDPSGALEVLGPAAGR